MRRRELRPLWVALVGLGCQASEAAPPPSSRPPPEPALAGYSLVDGEMVKVRDYRDEPVPLLARPQAGGGALDGQCTLGPLSGIISATYPGTRCCQEHDKCYDRHDCTARSWFGLEGLTCLGCDLRVVVCMATAGQAFGSQCDDWFNECEYASHLECVNAVCNGDPICGVEVCQNQLGYYPGDHYERATQDQIYPSWWNDGWYYDPRRGWVYLRDANCYRTIYDTIECEVGGSLGGGGYPVPGSISCDSWIGYLECIMNLI